MTSADDRNNDRNASEPLIKVRARPVRKLVIPLVLAVGMIAAASGLATTSLGCGDGDGPRPDGGPGDGGVDTPIV